MAEATLQGLIDLLAEESELTRTKGVNSLRSVQTVIEEKLIAGQLAVLMELQSIGDILKESLALDKDRSDDLRKAKLQSEDQQRESTEGALAAGTVAGKDKVFGDVDFGGLGNFLIPALAAYFLDLEDYFRVAALPKALEILDRFGKMIKGSIVTFADDIVRTLKAVFKPLKAPLVAVGAVVRGIGESIGDLGKTIKGWTKGFDFFQRSAKDVTVNIDKGKGPLKAISENAKLIGQSFSDFGKKMVGGVVNWVKGIGDAIKNSETFGKILKHLTNAFQFFKNVLSKLVLPLTILFSLFDFVSGFIDGFRQQGEDDIRTLLQKMFDGIIGGFREMVTSFFGGVLDILKKLVSWVADKLGFEEFSDMLDSFSFEEWFKKIWDGAVAMLGGLKDMIVGLLTFDKEKISSGFGTISDIVTPIIASVWNAIVSGVQLLASKLPLGADTMVKRLESMKMDVPEAPKEPPPAVTESPPQAEMEALVGTSPEGLLASPAIVSPDVITNVTNQTGQTVNGASQQVSTMKTENVSGPTLVAPNNSTNVQTTNNTSIQKTVGTAATPLSGYRALENLGR